MTWQEARSSLSPAELQGWCCYLLLTTSPRPHELIEVRQAASIRGIWLPETREQAASLLFRGQTPTPKQKEAR